MQGKERPGRTSTRERGPHDPLFLEAFIAQVETSDRRVCLVLDGAEHITHRSSLDGLALLVERVGDRLRLVLTTRSEPRLPLARWRSRGWLAHVRGDELRLDDDDAVAMADLLPVHGLGADAVLSLNRWVDGWPIGLHLTLLSLQGSEDPDADARRVAESEHVLTEYVTGEVIERLAPSTGTWRSRCRCSSWFDVDLCAALLSDGAVPVIRDLQRRGLFLTVIDPRRGAMRLHALFRDLLERELRWRESAGHQRLHRRAAELWLERGELVQAYRHLTAVGDIDSAHRLVVQPALDLVTGAISTSSSGWRSRCRSAGRWSTRRWRSTWRS